MVLFFQIFAAYLYKMEKTKIGLKILGLLLFPDENRKTIEGLIFLANFSFFNLTRISFEILHKWDYLVDNFLRLYAEHFLIS